MVRVIDGLEDWYHNNKDYYPQETIDNFVTTADIGDLIKEFRDMEKQVLKYEKALKKVEEAIDF